MNCRELVELFAAEAKLFTLEFEARGKLSSQEIKLGDCPLQLDFDLSMLSHDSRKLEPKSAFFALPGRT
ncbi:MAG: hypothetical protein Q4P08_01615, partial [Eubacteriales bacterium]|nr:hypothetical protein [Eubacteriales bacterium]